MKSKDWKVVDLQNLPESPESIKLQMTLNIKNKTMYINTSPANKCQ